MADILLTEDDFKLRSILEAHLARRGHEVIPTSYGQEAIDSLARLACDVVLLDIRLPDIMGTDVLKTIDSTYPVHSPVIIITGHGDKEVAIQAIRYGAFDFLEKPFEPSQLDEAIERALDEKRQDIIYFKNLIVNRSGGHLTRREKEVAILVAQGMRNEEVGKRLSLTSETVKTHLKHIFRKLGVQNRTALSAVLKKW